MGKPERCSVIIPTYNRANLLQLTLEALARQDIGRDAFEVLVVDDGSFDDTAAVVRRYEPRMNLRYFFQRDEGFRAAAARNVGIDHAAGDVCVFIDSGVLPHSRCLRAHLDSHADHEPVAVIGYVYCFNHDNQDAEHMLGSLDFTDPDATIDNLTRRRKWLDVREAFYDRYGDRFSDLPAPWVVYWTCNSSARTDQLRAIGGFDEAFRSWGAEDTDLGYRLHRDGARFVLDRAAGAIHFPHDKSTDTKNRTLYENYAYIVSKYRTPIIELLIDTDVKCFDINDVIRERRLPDCAEYLAAHANREATRSTSHRG